MMRLTGLLYLSSTMRILSSSWEKLRKMSHLGDLCSLKTEPGITVALKMGFLMEKGSISQQIEKIATRGILKKGNLMESENYWILRRKYQLELSGRTRRLRE